jgi:glycosyltransferase involved in cell wall biosynthesis
MDAPVMKKILLITNIPTPYRVPLFNVLSDLLRINGYQLKVIFSGKGYARRQFQIREEEFRFEYHFLEGGKYSSGETSERTFFFYKGLNRIIQKEKPRLCIVSGFSPATIACCFNKIFRGIPYIIWSGSVPHERNKNLIRNIQRKFLIRKASAFVAYGSRAKRYLLDMGADPEKVAIGINTVDTRYFYMETMKYREGQTEQAPFTFLYLGYLIPRKNPGRILEAIARLKKHRSAFQVIFVGDGISKPLLERQSAELGIEDLVMFTGYKQKEELPPLLAQSHVFLFQTDFDIWGLVLNETMAAGLASLVSPNAGACDDLLEEGVTGFGCNFENSEEAAGKMEWMIDHPEQVKQMGLKASNRINEKASLDKSAEGFLKAIQTAIKE